MRLARLVAVASLIGPLCLAVESGCRRAMARNQVEPQVLVSEEELNDSPSARFIRTAGLALIGQSETSRLAAGRAESAEVRNLANNMLHDHARMLDELRSAALALNIPVPATIPTEERVDLARLVAAPAGAFDREFLRQTTASHLAFESLLQEHSAATLDPRLQRLAAAWLATARSHHAGAQSLQLRR